MDFKSGQLTILGSKSLVLGYWKETQYREGPELTQSRVLNIIYTYQVRKPVIYL